MNIKGILLAPVGAVVGFVAGLIIGVLGNLVGLPDLPIVWGLCAIAGGYLAFVGAISMKALFSLALGVIALLCAAVILLTSPYFAALEYPPLTTIELRQILEKCSCEPQIQAEVDGLLDSLVGPDPAPAAELDDQARRWPGSTRTPRSEKESWRSLYDEVWSAAPALARFGKTLSHPTWDVVPHDYFNVGMPSHLRLRFGQHFHYQYIAFFRTGTDASLIMLPDLSMSPDGPYEHVTGNIYFEPGKPYARKR